MKPSQILIAAIAAFSPASSTFDPMDIASKIERIRPCSTDSDCGRAAIEAGLRPDLLELPEAELQSLCVKAPDWRNVHCEYITAIGLLRVRGMYRRR